MRDFQHMRFIEPINDRWQALADDDVVPSGPLLLSVEQWTARRDTLQQREPLGVSVPNTVDVELLRDDLPRWSLIVLQFPKWTDGRAYSQARLLRARMRFGGEIRASGEVLADMLPLLHRSGFDSVLMRADQSIESAQRALHFFAGHYQGDVHESRPAFGRPAA
jgi:uncharacterized protein (DUF934 family)